MERCGRWHPRRSGDGATVGLRVISITAQLPYGATEPFLIPELEELKRQGCEVTVVPVRPRGDVVHGGAAELLRDSVSLPLLSGAIVRAALAETIRSPRTVVKAFLSVCRSRSGRILVKNLSVFPKALWLAHLARRRGADHLHAHWASTPATLALVAGEVSNIPWSFTAHRWDIAENNLLRLKARRACFARAISGHGAHELAAVVNDSSWEPWVLHVGVPVPAPHAPAGPDRPFRVVTAARLVEKKGHVHLIEAVKRVKAGGVQVRTELAGDGPLVDQLRRQVQDAGLGEDVVFLGGLPHEDLMQEMTSGRWHAAVLPSVVTPAGQLEGIPVSLIEAMACGLPVISTATGGIPELLEDGAGLLVPPADPEALARGLERLASDPGLRKSLGDAGRKRVEQAFSVEAVAAALRERLHDCSGRT